MALQGLLTKACSQVGRKREREREVMGRISNAHSVPTIRTVQLQLPTLQHLHREYGTPEQQKSDATFSTP
jgi:hypothetical protein